MRHPLSFSIASIFLALAACHVAPAPQPSPGMVSLFDGVTLNGWVVPENQKKLWQPGHPREGVLECLGQTAGAGPSHRFNLGQNDLVVSLEFKAPAGTKTLPFAVEGLDDPGNDCPTQSALVGAGWNHADFEFHKDEIRLLINRQEIWKTSFERDETPSANLRLNNPGQAMEFRGLALTVTNHR